MALLGSAGPRILSRTDLTNRDSFTLQVAAGGVVKFDNLGTLIGVANRAGLVRPDGTLPKAGRALLADSLATIIGAFET